MAISRAGWGCKFSQTAPTETRLEGEEEGDEEEEEEEEEEPATVLKNPSANPVPEAHAQRGLPPRRQGHRAPPHDTYSYTEYTYWVRVPASGVRYVPRTMAPQVAATGLLPLRPHGPLALTLILTLTNPNPNPNPNPKVAATGLIPLGTVAVCMGGAVVDSRFCRRDEQSHRFVDSRWGSGM